MISFTIGKKKSLVVKDKVVEAIGVKGAVNKKVVKFYSIVR